MMSIDTIAIPIDLSIPIDASLLFSVIRGSSVLAFLWRDFNAHFFKHALESLIDRLSLPLPRHHPDNKLEVLPTLLRANIFAVYNLIVRAKESGTKGGIGLLCGEENNVVEEVDVYGALVSIVGRLVWLD